MRLRIASWNVNSVRMRRRALRRFVKLHAPHILCLQETKVADPEFPSDWFRELGFDHLAIHGQKSYHGVAIASRLSLSGVKAKRWCGKADSRHIYATLPNGVEIHNIYLPAGGDVPDPDMNEKFAHKLRFMKETTRWFRRRKQNGKRMVLLGDLNVAPHENDVWSHQRLRRVVTHTPVEVEALKRLQASCEWIDAVRHFVPLPERLYTWWSYRNPDWKRADKGRRLDHIWVSPALESGLRGAAVVKATRGWKTASDHVPVVITLEVS